MLTIEMQIQNVITTADLGQHVDARQFVNYKWGRYDREYYGGKCGYIKDETIRGRVTIFLTGKMISTGAKSITESKHQLQRALQLLIAAHLAENVTLKPKVQNVVATMDLQSKIDLNGFATSVSNAIFEPEQFPGLIHKLGNGTTCLIFASGKVVIVGAKSEEQISDTAEILSLKAKQFVL